MGNPQPGEVDGMVGGPDRWDNKINNKRKKKDMKKIKNNLSEASERLVNEFNNILDICSIQGLYAALINYLSEDQKREYFSDLIKDFNFYEDENDYEYIINADSDTQLNRIHEVGWDAYNIISEFVIYASDDMLVDFIKYVNKEFDIDYEEISESFTPENEVYSGYDVNMVQTLIDNGYIDSKEDFPKFADDYCFAIWAVDAEDLGKQYIDQFGYDKQSIIEMISTSDAIKYDKIGREWKTNLTKDEDNHIIKMSDNDAGHYIVDNFFGDIEEFIKENDINTIKSYINYEMYGDYILSLYDYVTGVDTNGNNFYILIFE